MQEIKGSWKRDDIGVFFRSVDGFGFVFVGVDINNDPWFRKAGFPEEDFVSPDCFVEVVDSGEGEVKC